MEAHQTDRLLHIEYNMTLLETRMALVEKENNFLTTLLPMCLPPSITTLYNGRYVKMDLTNLTKHHYCDFCKKTIPNQCGYLGYHVKNSGSGIDKCLSCASIHFVNNLNNKDESKDIDKNDQLPGTIVKKDHPNLIGRFITEGPDWRWGSQSGPCQTGTIIGMADSPGWVRVRWHTLDEDRPESIRTNSYRVGADGYYDLRYIDEDDSRIPAHVFNTRFL
jgi:hypothetical protein